MSVYALSVMAAGCVEVFCFLRRSKKTRPAPSNSKSAATPTEIPAIAPLESAGTGEMGELVLVAEAAVPVDLVDVVADIVDVVDVVDLVGVVDDLDNDGVLGDAWTAVGDA
jgi:hypothetical protein